MPDEYITIMAAARLVNRPRSSIQNLANRGHVRTQTNEQAPNPRQGRRLVHRKEVLAWFAPEGGADRTQERKRRKKLAPTATRVDAK